MSEYRKPLPPPSVESAPFWEACKRHELAAPRCGACSHHWFPATATCPRCWSTDWTWTRVSGRGKIYSFGVYHRAYHKGFADELPYALVIVELEEGPRLTTNVVDCKPDELRCDMPVEVVFEDVTPDRTLYKFRPVRGG